MATSILESIRRFSTAAEIGSTINLLPEPKKLTWKRWGIVGVGMSSILVCSMMFSLQVPFFPSKAREKGLSAMQYSLVFAIYELSIFFTSLVIGRYVTVLGPKLVFIPSILLAAGACIMFGFLPGIKSKIVFLTYCLIVRVFEAIGQSVSFISILTIMMSECSNYIPSVIAWSNTFYGIGMIIGPFFGEILYHWQGYAFPFSLVGLLLIVYVPVSLILLPRDLKPQENLINSGNSSTIFELFKLPLLWLGLLAVMISMISSGFLQVSLAQNMERFNLEGVYLGLLFVVNGVAYAIANPILGWFVEKGLSPELCMSFGAVLVGLGYILIDPVPLFPIPPVIWLAVLGLTLIGTGFAATHTPSLVYTKCISAGICPPGSEYESFISGLWSSSFSLGGFIGPTIGGALYDYNLRMATLILVILNWLVAFIFLSMTLYKMYKIRSIKQKGYASLT